MRSLHWSTGLISGTSGTFGTSGTSGGLSENQVGKERGRSGLQSKTWLQRRAARPEFSVSS